MIVGPIVLFPGAVDFSATLSAKGNFNKTGPLHLPAPTGKRVVEEVLGAHGLCGYGPSRR
jgi:hypothetical protein